LNIETAVFLGRIRVNYALLSFNSITPIYGESTTEEATEGDADTEADPKRPLFRLFNFFRSFFLCFDDFPVDEAASVRSGLLGGGVEVGGNVEVAKSSCCLGLLEEGGWGVESFVDFAAPS